MNAKHRSITNHSLNVYISVQVAEFGLAKFYSRIGSVHIPSPLIKRKLVP